MIRSSVLYTFLRTHNNIIEQRHEHRRRTTRMNVRYIGVWHLYIAQLILRLGLFRLRIQAVFSSIYLTESHNSYDCRIRSRSKRNQFYLNPETKKNNNLLEIFAPELFTTVATLSFVSISKFLYRINILIGCLYVVRLLHFQLFIKSKSVFIVE